MTVHDKSYGLLLTVAAYDEISKLCPGGDISKLNGLLFGGSVPEQNKNAIALICALSRGYESAKAFESADYTPDPITREMLLAVRLMDLFRLRNEAVAAFNAGLAPSVEVEESKKNESPEGK